MLAFANRMAAALATLLAASVVVFLAMAWLPGDPASLLLGLNADPERVAALRERMGLERPLLVQYLDWAGGFLTGDLGRSVVYDVPVRELVDQRLTLSLPLAGLSLLLSSVLALAIALASVALRGRADAALMTGVQFGLAVPNFWLALLFIYAFTLHWRVFPVSGFPGWGAPLAGLHALALPALALALPQAAILARVGRASLLDEAQRDYARTALAKGVSPMRTLLRHVLPNSLVPVLTILGLQFSFLVAGTIIIENVFALPGLGRLLFQAVSQRDIVTVRSTVMLLVALVVLVNLAVDLCLLALDPRRRAP